MDQLACIVEKLNQTFSVYSFGRDPAFSRYIPQVYDKVNWKNEFEPDFVEYFNGLMIKGGPYVKNVFLAVFPTEHILEQFIEESSEGDLLFMHHPLLMECGDPKGKWGRGFVPVDQKYIHAIKRKKLSVYTCHAPMDYHRTLGTNAAIIKALKWKAVDYVVSGKYGQLGIICSIDPVSTDEMIDQLTETFHIPYVDFEGVKHHHIQKVAVIAGCGDKVSWMEKAERKGVQAYISGEIHCHIDNDYGRKKYQEMSQYASKTKMSLIGVSHSASEFLVKRTLLNQWISENFDVKTILLPQEKWWL
ncbi:MAG: Nif3-like dinuclear metal center hexameric protein [Bacillaceae bacterium]|nr:Nif3-like dinuclear metal center hexameric protein [Bacillaceae bacterium]